MQDSNLALFRAAVVDAKAAYGYDGEDLNRFRNLITTYWRARRAYADATQMDLGQAHKLIMIAVRAK